MLRSLGRLAVISLPLVTFGIAPWSSAEAASASEMQELVRLLRENGPAGKTIVAAAQDGSRDEPVIIASHREGPEGRIVVTVAFQSRVGMMEINSGEAGDKGPGECNVVLQDVDGDGKADIAEFHCDRISSEMPKAIAVLGQPLFDNAVRALIKRLATV